MEFTEDKLVGAANEIIEALSDGFQLSDLAKLLRVGVEFAEIFNLSGAEKRVVAIRLIEKVIRETDTPWLPDSLTDPLMIKAVPFLIDLVIDATAGKLDVNGGISPGVPEGAPLSEASREAAEALDKGDSAEESPPPAE